MLACGPGIRGRHDAGVPATSCLLAVTKQHYDYPGSQHGQSRKENGQHRLA